MQPSSSCVSCVACCVLCVACCVLCVGCRVLRVVCCVLCVVCCVLCVVCCVLCVLCVLCVVRCVLRPRRGDGNCALTTSRLYALEVVPKLNYLPIHNREVVSIFERLSPFWSVPSALSIFLYSLRFHLCPPPSTFFAILFAFTSMRHSLSAFFVYPLGFGRCSAPSAFFTMFFTFSYVLLAFRFFL